MKQACEILRLLNKTQATGSGGAHEKVGFDQGPVGF